VKHSRQIHTEFCRLAGIRKDISTAEKSKMKSVFLGGTVDDKQWRKDIKHKFADKFKFIDPFDNDWKPEDNIYDECRGMLTADYVVFYKGGELTKKEQEFLRGMKERFKTFDDLDELTSYLQTL
jgi:hypothetical protein